MLKGYKASNFCVSTLQAAVTSDTTALEVALADADKFPVLGPDEWFMLTIDDKEVVKCVGRTSNILTVQRGQEGTTAQAWPAGTNVSLTVTAGVMGELTEQLERTPATVTARDLTFPEPDDGKGVGWAGADLANIEFATKTYVQNEISGAVGVTEAPNDGVAYVRRNLSWISGDSRYTLVSGSSALLPAGGSGSRPPSPATGATRLNTDTGVIEWWTGSAWVSASSSGGAALQNTVVWADDAGDLGGGSGFTWPALYVYSGPGQFTILDKINAGLPFRTLPAPTGGGSAAPFTILATQGSGSTASSLTKPGLTIPTGVVVLVVGTEADSSAPSVVSVSHPALGGQTLLFNSQSYSATNRVGRVTAYQFSSTNNTGDLVVNFDGTSWTSFIHAWYLPNESIGSFLGHEAGTAVTSGNIISVNRTDSSAAIDLCVGHGTFTVSGQTWSASRNNDTLQAPVWSSWTNMATTSGSGSVSGQTQTFTINPGNFAGGRAFVMQWSGPSGGPANYTLTNGDVGSLLLCQAGTTNLTLPVLSLPNGSDSNGLTGIEHYVLVEVPPSSTLNVIRGAGAELWSGYGSGNVSSFAVTTTAGQRKRITLAARHPNLWQAIAGETS